MTSVDFDIVQGSTFSTSFTLTNSDGSYINLSGYGLRGGIKFQYSNTGYLLSLVPTISNAPSGAVNLTILASDAALLPKGKFPYDIEAYVTGYVFKVSNGFANVFPEVTN